MKVYKNLMGKNDKIHSSVMAGIVEELWIGSITSSGVTIELTRSILDFELIMVVGTKNAYNHDAVSNILPTGRSGQYGYGVAGGRANLILGDTTIHFTFPTETTLLLGSDLASNARITAIYGLFPKN